MPKQVKGGGRKRDPARRLAPNKGRTATRAKKVLQHAMSSSENDEVLYKMFKAWARKYKKKYKTADEENERFKLWRSTKERVDAMYPLEPGGVTIPLTSFADWTDFEMDQACKGIYDDPYKRNQRTSEFNESKLGKEVAEGVKGQEVDLRKPLAGQKREMAKRLALNKGEKGKEKMQGAGEVVVGRMATRSSSRRLMEVRQHPVTSSESEELLYKMFKDWAKKHKKRYKTADEENKRFNIWRSEKEWIDSLPSLEPGVTYGLTFLSDFTASEIGEYNGAILVDDPCNGNPRTPEFYESKLGKEVAEAEAAFDKWAAEHKRVYDSKGEREERFAAYFRNKTRIDTLRKENPGCYSTYPHDLDIVMDQVLNINMLKNLLNGCSE